MRERSTDHASGGGDNSGDDLASNQLGHEATHRLDAVRVRPQIRRRVNEILSYK